MFQDNLTKIRGPLHEDRHTFLIISHSLIIIGKRNVSDECCRGNQNTHFMFSNCFFPKNNAVYNAEKYGTAIPATDGITRHMRIACWITEATNTHSEYVIIIACPLQKWLH
jgi:hypothetical protein